MQRFWAIKNNLRNTEPFGTYKDSAWVAVVLADEHTLAAENERLREALREIVVAWDSTRSAPIPLDQSRSKWKANIDRWDGAIQQARAALASTPATTEWKPTAD